MKLERKAFVFIRHAECVHNATGLIAGATDSPLSSTGVREAKSLADQIDYPWSMVFTSTLQRTIQTAEHALPNRPFISLKDLSERNWGDLEETTIPQNTIYEETPKNGESWIDFQKRILSSTNHILNQYSFPLIIGHSGTYRTYFNSIFGTPYCKRVQNAKPIQFIPIAGSNEWEISPFEGF